MPDGIHAEGTADLEKLAAALKEAADHDLTNNVRRSMRSVAKPVGEIVLREAMPKMPHRGGFVNRIPQTHVGVTSALVTRTVHVTLTMSNRGSNLRALDAGILRHPVFKRPNAKVVWKQQAVPARAFTHPFQAQAPLVRRATLDAMQQTLNSAARKVHH